MRQGVRTSTESASQIPHPSKFAAVMTAEAVAMTVPITAASVEAVLVVAAVPEVAGPPEVGVTAAMRRWGLKHIHNINSMIQRMRML